jgi:hypothetical protein
VVAPNTFAFLKDALRIEKRICVSGLHANPRNAETQARADFVQEGLVMTHEFNNDSNQVERKRVERDTYLSRAQAEADQDGGRFKKEITTTVNAVPTYPPLPASSPWASGFDQNVEPALGFAVDEMPAVGNPNEIQASSTLTPPEVHALPAAVEDRVGEPVGTTPLVPTGSATIKRRVW